MSNNIPQVATRQNNSHNSTVSDAPMYTTVGSLVTDKFTTPLHKPPRRHRVQLRTGLTPQRHTDPSHFLSPPGVYSLGTSPIASRAPSTLSGRSPGSVGPPTYSPLRQNEDRAVSPTPEQIKKKNLNDPFSIRRKASQDIPLDVFTPLQRAAGIDKQCDSRPRSIQYFTSASSVSSPSYSISKFSQSSGYHSLDRSDVISSTSLVTSKTDQALLDNTKGSFGTTRDRSSYPPNIAGPVWPSNSVSSLYPMQKGEEIADSQRMVLLDMLKGKLPSYGQELTHQLDSEQLYDVMHNFDGSRHHGVTKILRPSSTHPGAVDTDLTHATSSTPRVPGTHNTYSTSRPVSSKTIQPSQFNFPVQVDARSSSLAASIITYSGTTGSSILATGPGAPQPLTAGPPGLRRLEPSGLQERAAALAAQSDTGDYSDSQYIFGTTSVPSSKDMNAATPFWPELSCQSQMGNSQFGRSCVAMGSSPSSHMGSPQTPVSNVVASATSRRRHQKISIEISNSYRGQRHIETDVSPKLPTHSFFEPITGSSRIVDTLTAEEAAKYFLKGFPDNFSAPEYIDPVPYDWQEYYPRKPFFSRTMRQEVQIKKSWNYHRPKPSAEKPGQNTIGQERKKPKLQDFDYPRLSDEQIQIWRYQSSRGWNGLKIDQDLDNQDLP